MAGKNQPPNYNQYGMKDADATVVDIYATARAASSPDRSHGPSHSIRAPSSHDQAEDGPEACFENRSKTAGRGSDQNGIAQQLKQ